ncbi:hypothetical protein N4G70_26720 [Streptomyces sp. ASQP_92]|uniref:hypothetical protein n=1 Tax=Streptomyces sp. ASQP_92 TaxID=2979116 RepID=UPI0021C0FF95|nr:hypothetical protein [Streptomyces sp. ASQP_92]MCT9092435.1 hypothetical protein [Streptomyces sp. ASQP_92]
MTSPGAHGRTPVPFASLSDAYWLDTPLLTRPTDQCVLCDLLRTTEDDHAPAEPEPAPTVDVLANWARMLLLCVALAAITTALLVTLRRP